MNDRLRLVAALVLAALAFAGAMAPASMVAQTPASGAVTSDAHSDVHDAGPGTMTETRTVGGRPSTGPMGTSATGTEPAPAADSNAAAVTNGSPVQPGSDVRDAGPGTVTETRIVGGEPYTGPTGSAARLANAQANASAPVEAASPHSREAEKQYLKGAKALDDQDVRAAVRYFGRAVELDPHNQRYIVANEIARQHLVTALVEEAEKGRMMGHRDVERARLADALTLDPHNGIATQHLDELAREAIDPLGEERNENSPTNFAGPIELAPDPAKKSFHVKSGATALLKQVVAGYGITAVFDDSVGSEIRRLDADDLPYAQAAQMVQLVTNTFFVPLDPKRVLIATDNKLNRDKFERLTVETVYLPGLSNAEIVDVGNIARNVLDTPYANVTLARDYLTLRAPAGRVRALNAVLSGLIEGQSQVELEIRAFEVATTRSRNVGIQFPQQTTLFSVESEVAQLIQNNQSLVNQIISSGLANAGDTLKIAALLIASGQVSNSILSSPFVLFGGGLSEAGIVPGTVSAHLSLNASDVRSLDDLSLRVLNNQDATFRTGVRYPIITSTVTSTSASIPGLNTAGLSSTLASLGISASALGNVTQSSLPQIQYEDLGLTLKATPRIQLDNGVTLKFDLKIEALGGGAIDNIPILNNRQFTGIITVKDGNSVMLVSTLNRQESKAVSGLPGLSELPGFTSATDKSTEFDLTKLVITVTSHVVRQTHNSSAGRMVILPIHE